MSDTKLQAQLSACQKRVALLEAELAGDRAARPKVRIDVWQEGNQHGAKLILLECFFDGDPKEVEIFSDFGYVQETRCKSVARDMAIEGGFEVIP